MMRQAFAEEDKVARRERTDGIADEARPLPAVNRVSSISLWKCQ